jgi:putative thioredoxin
MLLSAGPEQNQIPQNSASIFDVGAADFEEKVLRTSVETPVIVDFWAPWCGPCKQLGPMLEGEVQAAGGEILMAKVNLDENPDLAQALRIQSVPTVFAFFQGQPVDAFTGAQPASKIKEFVGNLIKIARQNKPESLDIPATLKMAAEALAAGDLMNAQNLYAAVINQEEDNAQAYAGMVRTFIAAGQTGQADAIAAQVPESVAKSPVFDEARTALELAGLVPPGTADEYAAKLQQNPDDHGARFEMAMAHFAAGEKELAAQALLDILARARKWEEDKARQQLLKFFEAWGAGDPATLKARRKLSGILFS